MEQSFFISTMTSDKIESQIKHLKSHEASASNSIPTTIFEKYEKNTSVPLTKLINLSFNQGTFPAVLKIASVKPTFKKGDKLNVNNYIPISLISNMSKIIKKLIHKRLNFFLEQNNISTHFSLVLETNIRQPMHLVK